MKKYILGAVFSLVLIASPAFTQAATLTQQQISAIVSLLQSFGADASTIANVNTALTGGSSGGGGGAQPWCHTFNTDLTFGATNQTDLHALHTTLSKEDSSYENKDSFTENTAAAVVQFQAKYGIRQTGYVGPITRAKLNALYGCASTTPPPTILSIPSQTLPQATVGTSYSTSINATGGTGSYMWRITNGSLPPGFSTATGHCFKEPCQTPLAIIGTPTTPGTYPFTATVSDGSATASAEFSIVVVSSAQTTNVSNPGLAGALGAFDSVGETAPIPTSQSTSGLNYTWNRDLQIGSPYQGDVIALQQALTMEGVYAGEMTGGFYNQTYTAVQSFQRKHGIDPTGYVGSLTRAKLNALY